MRGAQAATLVTARDTSRDPRLAILAAIDALSQGANGMQVALRPWLRDTDPVVARAAAAILHRWSPGDNTIVAAPIKSAPIQPLITDIQNSRSRCATISLDNGKRIDLTMAMSDAPIAAARFLQLASDKFYDGLTFHRIEVNSFVQAGSPDANELSNGERFIRDEISLPLTGESDVYGQPAQFGVLAFVTRGYDTAAGSFFVPLVSSPSFTHEFTVFATFTTPGRVQQPWIDLLQDSQIVEGTRITSIREVPCGKKLSECLIASLPHCLIPSLLYCTPGSVIVIVRLSASMRTLRPTGIVHCACSWPIIAPCHAGMFSGTM